MASAAGSAAGTRVNVTWGLNDLPVSVPVPVIGTKKQKTDTSYPEWSNSPEDPDIQKLIEWHFKTLILTPYEIADCLKVLHVYRGETSGRVNLSCITSSGHHSSTVMPSEFTKPGDTPYVKAYFIIRGPHPDIRADDRWCSGINRISNSECVVQLAYAQLIEAIYDIFCKPDGGLGPQDWLDILSRFNGAMTLGREAFATGLNEYIDRARLLLAKKANPTPEDKLSYINLVQLMTELLRDDGFQRVQPDTYTVGSLAVVDFHSGDDVYVRTDGVETSDEIKKAAFNLIIMIEVDDGKTGKYKIRLDIDRTKLYALLRRKLGLGDGVPLTGTTRISYWVGQFIEFE